MYRLKTEDFVKKRFIALWGLLSFQAGFINSFGFLACHRFVSHVTGFGTGVGLAVGSGNIIKALELLSAPLSFIAGAWFSGYMTIAKEASGKTPRYQEIVFLMPLILIFLTVLGRSGVLGEFGDSPKFSQDFFLLNSLTFFCGMQNACFATLTRGQIRTTHLTGISTDLGTELALAYNSELTKSEKDFLIKRNNLRIVTIISFMSGAIISSIVDDDLGFWSLLIPAITSLFVAGVYVYQKPKESKK